MWDSVEKGLPDVAALQRKTERAPKAQSSGSLAGSSGAISGSHSSTEIASKVSTTSSGNSIDPAESGDEIFIEKAGDSERIKRIKVTPTLSKEKRKDSDLMVDGQLTFILH